MFGDRYLSNYATNWITTKLIRKIGSEYCNRSIIKIQTDSSFPRLINRKIYFQYIGVYILGSLSRLKIVHYDTSAMKPFLTSVSLQHEPKTSDVITLVKKTFFRTSIVRSFISRGVEMRISAREACVKPHLRTRSDIKIFFKYLLSRRFRVSWYIRENFLWSHWVRTYLNTFLEKRVWYTCFGRCM